MDNLKTLSDKVSVAIAAHDGSWQSQKALQYEIEQLRIAAMGPGEYITMLRYQPLQNMCIMIALEMDLLTPIIERKGESITAAELAAITNSDKLLTVRIMRMLTALHITEEVSHETYISNANASYLNHPSRQGAMRFINGPTMKSMSNVIPYVRANNGSFPQFPDRDQGQKSAAEFTYGMPLWELFRSQPDVLADFVAYLSGRREDMVGSWFDIYPVKAKLGSLLNSLKPDEALIVDVGGNIGYDLQAFKTRFPNHTGRLILQDLPENITKAQTSLAGTGIECMEHDFFTPQPIKNAKVYYFGGIYHDWPDAEAKKILSLTAQAMGADSRILIDEMPLPDENAPLDLVSYDVLMMLNVCGIERTIGQWKELLESCGLELVDKFPSKLDTVLEVKLKM